MTTEPNTIGVGQSNIIALDGEIVTIANGDLGDADTSYTYFDLASDGYKYFTLNWVIQNTTLTFEGSNDLPSVANASAVWRDLTDDLYGAATITATGHLIVDTPCPYSRMRLKRLTTNATNAFRAFLSRGR